MTSTETLRRTELERRCVSTTRSRHPTQVCFKLLIRLTLGVARLVAVRFLVEVADQAEGLVSTQLAQLRAVQGGRR